MVEESYVLSKTEVRSIVKHMRGKGSNLAFVYDEDGKFIAKVTVEGKVSYDRWGDV